MKGLVLSLGSTVCLALAACGASAPAASPAVSAAESAGSAAPATAAASTAPSAPKLQTVSIGVVAPSSAHAPLLVALGKGYFTDAGVQGAYQQVGQGQAATTALATGQLQVAVTVPSVALFNEIDGGLDTKIVSSMGAFPAQGQPAALVARKDLFDSGEVKTLADLKGRKLSLGAGTTGSQAYFTESMVRTAGLSLKDFYIVALDFPQAVAALKNKSIDATYLPDPFKTEAVRQGIAVPLAKPQNVGHGGVVTLFSSKFIAQHPDAAQAVMVALVRGARDLQGDGATSDDNLASLSKYTKLPVETLKASDPYAYDPNLTPDTETVMGMQQLFMANGQLAYTAPLPAERLVDGAFSKYAAEKLGPYKSNK